MELNHSEDVVRLATAANPMEAHLIEQALKAEGISCKVVGDYLDASIGDIPGIRPEVWVHRNDLAAAEAALAKSRQASPATGTGEGEAED